MTATAATENQFLHIPASVVAQGKKAEDLLTAVAAKSAEQVVVVDGTDESVGIAPDQDDRQVPSNPSDESYKSKYEVLQGKYDHEVPALAAQVRQLLEANRQQNEKIERLTQMLEKGPSRPDSEQGDTVVSSIQPGGGNGGTPKVNKDDFAGYGDEVLALVDLVNNMGEQMQGLKGEVQGVAGKVTQSREEVFFADLTKLAPGWQDLNRDPKFLAWLDQKETPRSRNTRFADFDGYVSEQNAAQVATYFNDFIKESKSGGAHASSRLSMEGEIVPDISGATKVTADEASRRLGFPVVTTEAFKKAVDDSVHKRITEKQFNEISNNYQRTLAAVREGKIQI